MLAVNARIVQTIFLEADAAEILSDLAIMEMISMPASQVAITLRYITPFMTPAQRSRVRLKIGVVAARAGSPLPEWAKNLSSP